ncbi:MAG: hypothetical protein WAV13_14295 [Thermodesulfovibrionales bacterium]
MTPEQQIKNLKEEIEILKAQNKILGESNDDTVSLVGGIILSIQAKDFKKAAETAHIVSVSAIKARAEASKLLKPFFKE